MARNRPDDDRPRRKAKSGGMPVWGWVLLGVGVLLFVGGGLVCAGMLWMGKKTGEALHAQTQQYEAEREQDLAYVQSKKADMTVKQFQANKPTTPTVIRAKATISSIWSGAFRTTEATHYSFHINGSSSSLLWVYADKSGIGKRLYEICNDGKDHWVTVRVHRVGPTGEPIGNDDNALIVELIEPK